MNSSKPVLYLLGAMAIILVLSAGIAFIEPKDSALPAAAAFQDVPGLNEGELPWGIGTTTLRSRLAALDLPALTKEGSAVHTHQHLDIFINGEAVPIPPEIGVNEEDNYISPLHTHDGSGIIHVESPTVQIFTLGQFFGIWGVRFTKNCIGGYCADAGKNLKVYLNGKEHAGDPSAIALLPEMEIAIVYGEEIDAPKTIPKDYDFPPGL
ncbi:MAG: hypothetical protein HYV68_01625 [Candidatus Taylorbacteria bacterium]|nr:hypothetical protein [Candidatus Taylorbacteria bacterium]